MPNFFTSPPADVLSNLNSSTTARYTGYLSYNNISVMVAGSPIFHSDYSGPIGGFLFFGLFQYLLPSHSQYFMDLVINFAVWDTSYYLILDKNSSELYDFMSSNFAYNSMKNNYLNFAAYYFTDGTPYFTIGYDFTSSNPLNQISMPENFQTVPATVITNMASPTYRYVDAYAYSNWYLDVVGCPIVHTDGSGPVVGFVLFGRFRNTTQPLIPSFATTAQIGLLPMFVALFCLLL
jgi:sensor domain CHASE-containing protein